MPSLPTVSHDYESPEIHSGFMHLIHSYHLLDSSFVDSWNESSSAPASSQTLTLLQQQLNLPHPSHISLTTIQKADILITQQWLRLIVWQSSMHQGLLSSASANESMTFRYPLRIAHSLLTIISSLPKTSIEVHGMGIFEKIFEIGNSMLDVMRMYGPNMRHENYGVAQDPFGMFVRTLSQTPNSQRQFADILLQKAEETPEILRWSGGLRPAISDGEFDLAGDKDEGLVLPGREWRGSIVGEITEASDNGTMQDDSDHSWTIWTEPSSPLEISGEVMDNATYPSNISSI
ncbi:hypothetical protein B7494_g5378 [Chlorociboria aeruginascens]|nr:hypothetical protein B7494_g5378 [Chlorociboria aeruginascens]